MNNVTSAHTQPTDDPVNTNPCWLSISPYISNCEYDGAGAALNHIFGGQALNPRNNGALSGSVVSFDQQTYMPSGVSVASQSLATTGYAYIPAACANHQPCKVRRMHPSASIHRPSCNLIQNWLVGWLVWCRQIHISFHGCEQNYNSVGFDYVQHTGFNKWADTNNIVMVYPQTVNSELFPGNPNGCWDWWGYAGSNYDVQSGGQMQFAMSMYHALHRVDVMMSCHVIFSLHHTTPHTPYLLRCPLTCHVLLLRYLQTSSNRSPVSKRLTKPGGALTR